MSKVVSPLKRVVESLPFVRSHGIEISSIGNGECIAEMPFQEAFSTPPRNFPAAMIGMLGDVAGITACISALKPGLICSTIDYTIKMTGFADGDRLIAEAEALNVGGNVATGQARIFSCKAGERKLCAVVLVTGRVVDLKQENKNV